MPWECSACGTAVAHDSVQTCPSCNEDKSAWSLQPEVTRQLVLPTKSFKCLRGEAREPLAPSERYASAAWNETDAATALRRSALRRLAEAGRLPAPHDVLCVRVDASRQDERAVRLLPLFEQGLAEPVEVPPTDAGDLHVLCVFGPTGEGADPPVPGVQVLDVTDDAAPEGFAPSLEVRALKRRKKTIRLEAARKVLDLLELQDALFRTDSAVVMPEGDEPEGAGSEGPAAPPSAVGLVATTLRYLEEHPGKRLLVAGHTDTTGSAQYNLPLSEQRARAGLSLLVGDRAAFVEVAEARHEVADYQQILSWVARVLGWPCDPLGIDGAHGPNTTQAIRGFQQTYNESGFAGNPAGAPLAVSGRVDAATWGAFFDCYEHETARELGLPVSELARLRAPIEPLDPDHFSVGCGEHHPIDGLGKDDYRSELNRRVEVLLFDPGEEPRLDCHQSGCRPELCELYQGDAYDRQHLPPMISAREWTARWEGEARSGGSATMVLDAPGLPAGHALTFVVHQEGFGPVGAPVEALSEEGRCAAPFGDFFHPEAITPREVELGPDEDFAPVRFTFVVTGAGRRVSSGPIDYADTFHAQVVHEDERLLADTPFVLRTRWGDKRTRSDAQAVIRVAKLPPGGVRLVLDNDVVVER